MGPSRRRKAIFHPLSRSLPFIIHLRCVLKTHYRADITNGTRIISKSLMIVTLTICNRRSEFMRTHKSWPKAAKYQELARMPSCFTTFSDLFSIEACNYKLKSVISYSWTSGKKKAQMNAALHSILSVFLHVSNTCKYLKLTWYSGGIRFLQSWEWKWEKEHKMPVSCTVVLMC